MYDRSRVLGNCRAASGFQGAGVVNLTAEKLFDLLDSHAQTDRGELKRACKDLLTSMNANFWNIAAGIHAGGVGAGHGADPRHHITLVINHHSYHLRLSQSGSGYKLIQIT